MNKAYKTGFTYLKLIFILMALAVAYFAWDKSRDTEQTAADELPTLSDKSIAVLPFVNMSSDPEQEYFSDGLSEELLNLLAKNTELKVAARTSSFSLKGKDLQMSEVGRILKVAHVLEGSVRRAGDQVHITAQLIKVDDGYHMWSETYDRPMDNVFAIQDEIAGEVVAQLKVLLLGDVQKTEAIDPEAYDFFLEARHNAHLGTAASFEQAKRLYRQAISIAPEYTKAWVGISRIFMDQASRGQVPPTEGYSRARETAQRALSINSHFAPAHASLSHIAVHARG